MSYKGLFLRAGIDPTNGRDLDLFDGYLRLRGRTVAIDSEDVTVILRDADNDVLWASGTTVPTATKSGYAKGGLFIKTDAIAGTKSLYENQGTNTSADFNLVGLVSGSEIVETVANNTGGTLARGTVVYRSGYDATLGGPEVTESEWDDDVKSAELVIAADIADGAIGTAYLIGTVTGTAGENVDTSGATVGNKVYLTAVAGVVSHVLPAGAADTIVEPVGVVRVVSATVGSIYFYPGVSAPHKIGTQSLQNDCVTNVILANITRGSVKVGGTGDVPTDLVALTTGQLLLGDGTDILSVAMSGDATIIADGTITISADAVDNTKLANMTRGTVKVGGAADAPTDYDAKTTGQLLLGDGTDILSVAMSGDATIIADGTLTIAADAVDNTKLANITRGSVKVGGAADAPTDLVALTNAQILIGDGTDLVSVPVSGSMAITNAGVVSFPAHNVKTIKYSISYDDFVANADKVEQGIQLGGAAIIPALGRVQDIVVHCSVNWTGSAGNETGLGTEIGNASGGAQYIASANVDDVDDISYIAAAGTPVLAPSVAATSVYISCTPTINDWDELTAGTTDVYVTFTDNSAV